MHLTCLEKYEADIYYEANIYYDAFCKLTIFVTVDAFREYL